MPSMDDMQLLRDYASRNSEDAFATLVSRHLDLVYSAALRHVGNHHQAQEISQAVFVILARKAGSLSAGTVLAGWLFRTARLTAANYLRSEIRRARREQEAYMQSNPTDNTGERWPEVAPALNDVIDSLREKERNAIVLRYLQGKDYREVTAVLGGSAEAAQMRVSRALEKMRKLFARRGVVTSVAALAGMMAAQGAQAAPIGVAATVSAAAIHGATLSASTLSVVEGTLKLMAWTKVKFAVGAGVVALLACQYHQNAVQARQVDAARETLERNRQTFAAQEGQIAALEQQNTAIAETRQSQALELERLRARRKVAASAGQANSAAGTPTTLLSATLQDPEARALLRSQIVGNYRTRYGTLAKELRIGPEEGDKLVQLAADESMKVLEAVAAFRDGKISADAALKVEAEAIQNGTNEVRLKLGEEGLARFEEDTRSYPARTLVAQFDKQLGPFPISAYQREGLLNILQAEPLDLTRQLAGEIPVELVVNPEELEQGFAQQAAANQRILQRAAGLLAPDQLEALQAMQADNLSAAKRQLLRMLRKL
jgi:RNA polymerase sigma factor (sigma-70 family)